VISFEIDNSNIVFVSVQHSASNNLHIDYSNNLHIDYVCYTRIILSSPALIHDLSPDV